MDDILGDTVAQQRFQLLLISVFAGTALLLTALGVYGVVSYSVACRRRELDVRMALGAQAADVKRLVLGEGLRPVLAGLAAGLVTALAAGPVVRMAERDGIALLG